MSPFTWTDDYSRTDPSTHVARNRSATSHERGYIMAHGIFEASSNFPMYQSSESIA